MFRNCTVYAVEIYNCEFGKFELLEAWQITRAWVDKTRNKECLGISARCYFYVRL